MPGWPEHSLPGEVLSLPWFYSPWAKARKLLQGFQQPASDGHNCPGGLRSSSKLYENNQDAGRWNKLPSASFIGSAGSPQAHIPTGQSCVNKRPAAPLGGGLFCAPWNLLQMVMFLSCSAVTPRAPPTSRHRFPMAGSFCILAATNKSAKSYVSAS